MSPAGAAPAAGRRLQREPLSLAPMMELTDRHFRHLLRLITQRTLLYTEMITAQAVLYGDASRLLGRGAHEGRVALQLGGDDPEQLAQAARLAVQFGYAEVNLNVGCPSSRVQSGNFGACLMAAPQLVADCVTAMRQAVDVPVTVKHRIGIDQQDSYDQMLGFVRTVAGPLEGAPNSDAFTVHARKAWLQGLSPKENRTIPPLRYADVYRLKQDLPQLVVELNGGVSTLAEAAQHLRHVDGVMIGRALYEDPFRFAAADELIQSLAPSAAPLAELPATRRQVVLAMLPYIEQQRTGGTPLGAVSKHLLGLFRAQPGGKAWRRHISQRTHLPGAGPEVIEGALALLPEGLLDAPLRGAPQNVRAA